MGTDYRDAMFVRLHSGILLFKAGREKLQNIFTAPRRKIRKVFQTKSMYRTALSVLTGMPGGPGSPLSPCNNSHLTNESVEALLWVLCNFTAFKITSYLFQLYICFQSFFCTKLYWIVRSYENNYICHIYFPTIYVFFSQILTGGPLPNCETYTEFPFSPLWPGSPFKGKKSFKTWPTYWYPTFLWRLNGNFSGCAFLVPIIQH